MRIDELQSFDPDKALFDMLLHLLGILLLAQDLQQVVVRKEVEARKHHALGLEVRVELLLDNLQFLVRVHQGFQETLRGARPHCVWVAVHLLRHENISIVDLVKQLRLFRQLLANIFRSHENGLEVHPLAVGVQVDYPI